MPLVRVKDRRTITLSNFTFADGEVKLIHPMDIPFEAFGNLVGAPQGFEEYLHFCMFEGVLSTDEFSFILELSPTELVEFSNKLQPYLRDGKVTPPIATPMSQQEMLADDDEALIDKFRYMLNDYPEAQDPFDGDDEEGDDGLASR